MTYNDIIPYGPPRWPRDVIVETPRRIAGDMRPPLPPVITSISYTRYKISIDDLLLPELPPEQLARLNKRMQAKLDATLLALLYS